MLSSCELCVSDLVVLPRLLRWFPSCKRLDLTFNALSDAGEFKGARKTLIDILGECKDACPPLESIKLEGSGLDDQLEQFDPLRERGLHVGM